MSSLAIIHADFRHYSLIFHYYYYYLSFSTYCLHIDIHYSIFVFLSLISFHYSYLYSLIFISFQFSYYYSSFHYFHCYRCSLLLQSHYYYSSFSAFHYHFMICFHIIIFVYYYSFLCHISYSSLSSFPLSHFHFHLPSPHKLPISPFHSSLSFAVCHYSLLIFRYSSPSLFIRHAIIIHIIVFSHYLHFIIIIHYYYYYSFSLFIRLSHARHIIHYIHFHIFIILHYMLLLMHTAMSHFRHYYYSFAAIMPLFIILLSFITPFIHYAHYCLHFFIISFILHFPYYCFISLFIHYYLLSLFLLFIAIAHTPIIITYACRCHCYSFSFIFITYADIISPHILLLFSSFHYYSSCLLLFIASAIFIFRFLSPLLLLSSYCLPLSLHYCCHYAIDYYFACHIILPAIILLSLLVIVFIILCHYAISFIHIHYCFSITTRSFSYFIFFIILSFIHYSFYAFHCSCYISLLVHYSSLLFIVATAAWSHSLSQEYFHYIIIILHYFIFALYYCLFIIIIHYSSILLLAIIHIICYCHIWFHDIIVCHIMPAFFSLALLFIIHTPDDCHYCHRYAIFIIILLFSLLLLYSFSFISLSLFIPPSLDIHYYYAFHYSYSYFIIISYTAYSFVGLFHFRYRHCCRHCFLAAHFAMLIAGCHTAIFRRHSMPLFSLSSPVTALPRQFRFLDYCINDAFAWLLPLLIFIITPLFAIRLSSLHISSYIHYFFHFIMPFISRYYYCHYSYCIILFAIIIVSFAIIDYITHILTYWSFLHLPHYHHSIRFHVLSLCFIHINYYYYYFIIIRFALFFISPFHFMSFSPHIHYSLPLFHIIDYRRHSLRLHLSISPLYYWCCHYCHHIRSLFLISFIIRFHIIMSSSIMLYDVYEDISLFDSICSPRRLCCIIIDRFALYIIFLFPDIIICLFYGAIRACCALARH